jgi:lipid II:glycine glycyltransferase (peptidoglycan interpeptide bridge formation enzyme)
MVTIKKKRLVFILTECWFGYKYKWSDLFLPSCYKGLREDVNKNFYWGIKAPSKTAVLSLDKSVDEIFANFSTSHKREMKKAEANGVKCYFNDDRKQFAEFYNTFAKIKNLYTLDTERHYEFNNQDWKYSYALLDNEILVAHSYLGDKETGIVRSMQSASLRLNSDVNPRQISQANKLLHFFDIKHFKEDGFHEYDFGGWDDVPSLWEFKHSFGAAEIEVFNYYTYFFMLTPKLKKLLLFLRLKKNYPPFE